MVSWWRSEVGSWRSEAGEPKLKAFVQEARLVQGGRVLAWEKRFIAALLLAIFGRRLPESRDAIAECRVVVRQNRLLDLTMFSAEWSFIASFSPSAQTAIRHSLGRVSEMMVMRVRGRLIFFGYPESRNG